MSDQEKEESYFSDGDPEADFKWEFTDVPQKTSKRRALFYAAIGFALVCIAVMALLVDVEETPTPETVSPTEKQWCIEHTVSKQELRDCLSDPHYQTE